MKQPRDPSGRPRVASEIVQLPTWLRAARLPSTIRQLRRSTFRGMDETQILALHALRELLDNPARDDWDKLVAASRTLIKAIETGQSARRLADVIMIDRTATAAAEIATLRQKLTAAEARIREMGQHNMIEADKRFASWKSRIPTLDYMCERMAALLRDMNNPSSV